MQVLKDLLVKGRAYLDGLINHTSDTITVLVIDGTEVKKRQVGSIVLMNNDDYLDSIGVSVPAFMEVTVQPSAPESPHLTITLKSQTKNYVFAAPDGSNGTPSFRNLVSNDIPTLSISKISNLESILASIVNPIYYFNDQIEFNASHTITINTPRYINLNQYIDTSDPGVYNFRIDILLYGYHQGASNRYQIVTNRTYDVSVLTDHTTSNIKRVTDLKTISHSSMINVYNSSGTSIISSHILDEHYIIAEAEINGNNARIKLSHILDEHPNIISGDICSLHGKYTVITNFLNTNLTPNS